MAAIKLTVANTRSRGTSVIDRIRNTSPGKGRYQAVSLMLPKTALGTKESPTSNFAMTPSARIEAEKRVVSDFIDNEHEYSRLSGGRPLSAHLGAGPLRHPQYSAKSQTLLSMNSNFKPTSLRIPLLSTLSPAS